VGTNSSEFDTRIELAFQEARSAYLVRKRLCWLPAGQALEQALEQVPEATAEQAPRRSQLLMSIDEESCRILGSRDPYRVAETPYLGFP